MNWRIASKLTLSLLRIAQKELNGNVQKEQKLIKDIEDAKLKLANVQGTSESIRSTIMTIEELQWKRK